MCELQFCTFWTTANSQNIILIVIINQKLMLLWFNLHCREICELSNEVEFKWAKLILAGATYHNHVTLKFAVVSKET